MICGAPWHGDIRLVEELSTAPRLAKTSLTLPSAPTQEHEDKGTDGAWIRAGIGWLVGAAGRQRLWWTCKWCHWCNQAVGIAWALCRVIGWMKWLK